MLFIADRCLSSLLPAEEMLSVYNITYGILLSIFSAVIYQADNKYCEQVLQYSFYGLLVHKCEVCHFLSYVSIAYISVESKKHLISFKFMIPALTDCVTLQKRFVKSKWKTQNEKMILFFLYLSNLSLMLVAEKKNLLLNRLNTSSWRQSWL